MQLDELDQQILAHLQEDGRTSYVTLASTLGVSEGTIRKRMRRLENENVVRIIGITDPVKVGLDTVAYVWFEIERTHLEEAIERLKLLEEVRYLIVTTGSHDLVAMVVVPSREDLVRLLNDELSTIPGIISTQTSIVLKIHKQTYDWAPFPKVIDTANKEDRPAHG